MDKLELTHSGKFSERASAMFTIIFDSKGEVEIGMGLGFSPTGKEIGILVTLGKSFSTVFLPKEARAVVEIIEDTNEEEAPFSVGVERIFKHIVSDLKELANKAEELQREAIDKKLN